MSDKKAPIRATQTSLAEFLAHHKFPGNFPNDGTYYRFDRQGGNSTASFYCGEEFEYKGKRFLSVHIGDYREKDSYLFRSNAADLTPSEAEELDRLAEEMREQKRTAKIAAQAVVAVECQTLWVQGITRGTTPYLDRKKIPHLYGARIHPHQTDVLLVPLQNSEGTLTSLQRIYPDGGKLLWAGGQKRGCFHSLGTDRTDLNGDGPIYIAEGFATACSIAMALGTGSRVVCAFDTHNLRTVGEILLSRYPNASLIYCADNDCHKDAGSNPGVQAAADAISATGGEMRVPHFATPAPNLTDFNDLHCAQGLDAVKEQLLAAPVNGAGAGVPAPKGKKKVDENMLAEMLHAAWAGKLLREEKDLFAYSGGLWTELGAVEIDRIKNQLNAMTGNRLSSKDVDGAYRTFFRSVPGVPHGISLHSVRSDRVNFLNGTLHLSFRPKTHAELTAEPGTAYSFGMEFRPHNPLDYCTSILPLEYKPRGELPINRPFEEMLKRVWPDTDPDARKKIELYEELLGASLLPIFPKIFFFVGAPRSGKSTLLALVRKLIGEQNIASVDPSRWGKEFQLEPMINRLANVHEDISTTKTIDDSIMKSIIDRLPLGVNRKGKSVVQARLPGLHAFGCNDMPRSLEGGSGAYNRRAIVIRTETPQAGQDGGGSFSQWVWDWGPDGVLKAALTGLERLLANGGQYTVPESSRRELHDWGMESDMVGQFLEAIEHGEVKHEGQATILVGQSLSIPKTALYSEFLKFVNLSCPRGYTMSHMAFTKRLRQDLRFVERRNMTVRTWLGLGFTDSI